MEIDSVRGLKQEITATLSAALKSGALELHGFENATKTFAQSQRVPGLALGIAQQNRSYSLAVRIQDPLLQSGRITELIKRLSKNEVDIRFIGQIRKFRAPALQLQARPLEIGCSIGHFRVTAGTLGCFVKLRSTGEVMVLSNNHVLADENEGKPGDDIIQPGKSDGGQDPADRIGTLSSFVQLDFTGKPNTVDCAVGTIDNDVTFSTRPPGMGNLVGVRSELGDLKSVLKIGRTTGKTQGAIGAFEVDNLKVQYDAGVALFDGQIEIDDVGGLAFSQDGDSGSLILDQEALAVALLFAGGDGGSGNAGGLTYANHLPAVLAAVNSDLMT